MRFIQTFVDFLSYSFLAVHTSVGTLIVAVVLARVLRIRVVAFALVFKSFLSHAGWDVGHTQKFLR